MGRPRGSGFNAGEIDDELHLENGQTLKVVLKGFVKALLKTAELIGDNPEALIGLQQAVHRKVQALLEDPKTEPLARAIQKVALRIHEGAGNPPTQRVQKEAHRYSELESNFLDKDINLHRRVINRINTFLCEKTGKTRESLSLQDFFEHFNHGGRFNTVAFETTQNTGRVATLQLRDEMIKNGFINEDDYWTQKFTDLLSKA